MITHPFNSMAEYRDFGADAARLIIIALAGCLVWLIVGRWARRREK